MEEENMQAYPCARRSSVYALHSEAALAAIDCPTVQGPGCYGQNQLEAGLALTRAEGTIKLSRLCDTDEAAVQLDAAYFRP